MFVDRMIWTEQIKPQDYLEIQRFSSQVCQIMMLETHIVLINLIVLMNTDFSCKIAYPNPF